MKVIITPSPEGISAEIEGVKGSGCSTEMQKILQALTVEEVTDRQLKPEYYQETDAAQRELE